jgi:hypothetical protein
MASILSLAQAQSLLDLMTGRAAAQGSTTFTGYLAACTAAPSGTTTAALVTNELATAGYARQTPTWSAPSSAGSPSETHDTALVTFGPFSADPAAVTHLVYLEGSSGTSGVVHYIFELTSSVDAGNGDSITIAASALALNAAYQA